MNIVPQRKEVTEVLKEPQVGQGCKNLHAEAQVTSLLWMLA
jgi:hypothetical protein